MASGGETDRDAAEIWAQRGQIISMTCLELHKKTDNLFLLLLERQLHDGKPSSSDATAQVYGFTLSRTDLEARDPSGGRHDVGCYIRTHEAAPKLHNHDSAELGSSPGSSQGCRFGSQLGTISRAINAPAAANQRPDAGGGGGSMVQFQPE